MLSRLPMALAAVIALAGCSQGTGSAPYGRGAADPGDGEADLFSVTDAAVGDALFIADAALGFGCTGAIPSFAGRVEPIFLASCSGAENCHATPQYAGLVGATIAGGPECAGDGADVVPGSPEKSYLMRKLTGIGMCPPDGNFGAGVSMPPGGRLAAVDIQTIADWICEGAPDN